MADTSLTPVNKQLPALPDLPEHFNPIKALGKEGKEQLAIAILSHYEAGRSMYDIAHTLGVHPTSVYRLVTSHSEEEWKAVTIARYQAMTEDAERELETAADTVATTRARERLASARWQLERLHRRIYGQESTDVGQRVAIQINLGAQPVVSVSEQSSNPAQDES